MVLQKDEFCKYRLDSNSPWVVGTYAGHYMTQYMVTMHIRVSHFILSSNNVNADFTRLEDEAE